MVQLEVVTPYRHVLSTEVESVIIPSTEGYLGIMKNHAPLAGLRIGVVHYGPAGGDKELMAVSGGFVEVSDNKVTILADTAELSGEIDVLRAEDARRRAEQRLRAREANVAFTRAQLALERALTRLQAAGADKR